jgi:hypothetical protein
MLHVLDGRATRSPREDDPRMWTAIEQRLGPGVADAVRARARR